MSVCHIQSGLSVRPVILSPVPQVKGSDPWTCGYGFLPAVSTHEQLSKHMRNKGRSVVSTRPKGIDKVQNDSVLVSLWEVSRSSGTVPRPRNEGPGLSFVSFYSWRQNLAM